MTGFGLADGIPERGIPAATPRHWVLGVVFVIIAQWIIDLAQSVDSLVVALIANVVGFSGWVVPFSAVSWLVLPFALVAGLTIWLSRRFDGRGFRAFGVNMQALLGAAPWLLAGAIVSGATLVNLFFLPSGWLVTACDALLWLTPTTIIQAGAEELMFRGALLSILVARYGAARGVVISSLLFAMWHLYPGQAPIDAGMYAAMTFVLGLGFGILALHQGHIGGAIALHVVWNVIADVEAGFANSVGVMGASGDFWTTYLTTAFREWTLEDLTSQDTVRGLYAPLLFQTLIILAACRTTLDRMFAQSAPLVGSATVD